MDKRPYEFELERIKALIKEGDARRVGLQLPDGLKTVATDIAAEISRESRVDVILSGNSCYGTCDVDEKLARIVDLLFHFGHSEIFPLRKGEPVQTQKGKIRGNVVFIELRSTIEIKPVVEEAVAELKEGCIGLVATVQHVHALKEAEKVLARAGKKVIIGKSDTVKYDGQVLGCEFSSATVPVPCDEILFIGSGNFHPAGLALYTGKRVIAADPFTMQISVTEPEALRKKRYGVIARALDARSFGIVMGLKSGQFNPNEALTLKRKAVAKGLDAHLIVMEEITEASLLGFNVDAFVNTACPRLVEDLVHFNKPVLSINEFEVVLGERSWDGVWQ